MHLIKKVITLSFFLGVFAFSFISTSLSGSEYIAHGGGGHGGGHSGGGHHEQHHDMHHHNDHHNHHEFRHNARAFEKGYLEGSANDGGYVVPVEQNNTYPVQDIPFPTYDKNQQNPSATQSPS